MKRFKKAYIEITNNCNLDCSFCPKTKRDKKYISILEYEKIINEIKHYVNFIYLHLMGEPLLHPNLKEILDISEREKIKINITSNGTLIKNKLDDILNSNAVRKVSFSLHSFEANDKNNFDEYINNIIDASKKLSEKNISVVLKLWNLDSTNNDVEDKKGKNNLNENIFEKIFLSLSNDISENRKEKILKEINEKNTSEINKKIYLQLGEKFEWPISTNEENSFEKIFCYGSIDQFGILVNGDVVPCCLDSEGMITFGNLYEKSFKDIIDSNEFVTFNKKIKQGICPSRLCEKCTYARRRV